MEARRILADAGFPLPLLVPLELPSKEISSSFGTLSVGIEDEGRGPVLLCDARGEITELLRLGTAAGARGSTPRAAAPFALRVLDDRVLHWSAGS